MVVVVAKERLSQSSMMTQTDGRHVALRALRCVKHEHERERAKKPNERSRGGAALINETDILDL